MQAVQINQYGDNQEIVLQETAEPVLKEGQVSVDVKAASCNPFDITIRSGAIQKMMPFPLPLTLGGDFAGVTRDGNEVYGSANVANGGSGSMAQVTAANLANLAAKPKNISWVEAASLPLTGCSAIQAIDEHIALKSGEKILIHGGAGGIGSLAIQLAKARGAYVATTASGEGIELAKKLGADLVIDYSTQKFEAGVKDYGAVFDTVGGEITERSLQVLTPDGRMVTMIGQSEDPRVIRQGTKVNTANLDKLRAIVESGVIKPQIAQVFPLAKAREAYELLEHGHPLGKVVIEVSG